MNYLGVLGDLVRVHRAQRWHRERLRALQTAKLRRLVGHSWQTSAYWRGVMEAAAIRPEDIRTLDDLCRFPITTRADLQAQPIGAITSSAFAAGRVEVGMTSGSSGRPLRIHRDPAYVRLRKSLFLRTMGAAGLRASDRMLILVDPKRKRATPLWPRWHNVDANTPPERLLEIVRRLRPTALYGWRTPVVQLARHLRALGADRLRLRLVFTTAETPDDLSTALLEEQFGCPVFDVYATTELGIVGFQCREKAGYHLAEDMVVVEFLPIEAGATSCRLVATNLELLATPLIRYDTGDLAAAPEREPCACGRRLLRFERVEGRAIDGICLPGGRMLSPYALTLAVEPIPGMERYQVIQDALDRYRLRVQGRFADRAAARGQIVAAVRGVVGQDAAVEVSWEDRIEPVPGRKFRVVESKVAAAGGPPPAPSCPDGPAGQGAAAGCQRPGRSQPPMPTATSTIVAMITPRPSRSVSTPTQPAGSEGQR